MVENEANDLRVEVLQLASEVSTNTAALAISAAQQRETKRLAKRANLNSIIAAVSAVVAVIAVIVALVVGVKAGQAAEEAKKATAANKANQVQNCQNSNEARAGAKQLWNFIVDTSVASNPEAPLAVKEFYADLRVYVNELYGEHDCSDLGKVYKQPTPPDIPTLDEIKGDKKS